MGKYIDKGLQIYEEALSYGASKDILESLEYKYKKIAEKVVSINRIKEIILEIKKYKKRSKRNSET